MRKTLAVTAFMLGTLAWAPAQQPSSMTEQSGGQATSPSSQTPGASQPPPSTPGSTDQDGAQAGPQGQAENAPITEGCLGGSNPNFTITDETGTTYKLNLPPNADGSILTPHVGESVMVLGDLNDVATPGKASIDVRMVGRGTSKCPASGSGGTQPPPKQ
jgi:hypothetical protein